MPKNTTYWTQQAETQMALSGAEYTNYEAIAPHTKIEPTGLTEIQNYEFKTRSHK